MNTPRLITDANGNTVWQWGQDEPFGDALPNQDPNGMGNQFVFNPRFAGQYYDVETGLHYNYYRDFDPMTGRYIESDPLGLYGGQASTYAYVGGNPVSLSDPFGLAPDYGTFLQNHPPVPPSPSLSSVDDSCVQAYLNNNYGNLGGFLSNMMNVQQYMPSSNPNNISSVQEALYIADEKLALTQGPQVIGRIIMANGNGGFLTFLYEPGVGLVAFGGLASGTLEVAGALLTPFASIAMFMAQHSCMKPPPPCK